MGAAHRTWPAQTAQTARTEEPARTARLARVASTAVLACPAAVALAAAVVLLRPHVGGAAGPDPVVPPQAARLGDGTLDGTPDPSSGSATPAAPGAVPAPPPVPVLRPGARGPEVAALQRALRGGGYQVRTITGTYDTETQHAVLAVQKVHGLRRDGVATPAVRAALAHPVAVRPRLSRPGFRMEVDLTRQVALAVRDGVVEHVYDVSTGRAATPTPQGEFTVQYKIDGYRHARLGTLWRPVYFTHTGIAFHGNEPVRPYPDSHGCVRMTDASMDELFGLLEPGVPVSVYA